MRLPDELRMMARGLACGGDVIRADRLARLAINADRLVEENAKLRHELANLIYAAENNTGHEPSLSCFHRAIDEANALIKNQLTEQNNEDL